MGDEFATDAGELTAGYALYGTTGWDDVTVYDSAGLLWRRDLHAETGLSLTSFASAGVALGTVTATAGPAGRAACVSMAPPSNT